MIMSEFDRLGGREIMSNRTYDILKIIAQVIFPALGTLYFALSKIWGLPYGTQIVGTLAAIDTFLGAILEYSSNKYRKLNEGIENIEQ